MENIPRTIPEGLGVVIRKSRFPRPAIFDLLMKKGVSEEEMWGTFNMGIGFVLVTPPDQADGIIAAFRERNLQAYNIGAVAKSGEDICLG